MTLSISALPSEGSNIPEQLRVIRAHHKELKATEIGALLKKFEGHQKWQRLTVGLLNALKDVDLATEALLGYNYYVTARVVKFKWLFDTPGKGLLTEDFLGQTFYKLALSTRIKVLESISKFVTDTTFGDNLYKQIRQKSLKLSNHLLGACSNALILEVYSSEFRIRFTGTHLSKILKTRFESGCDLVEGMLKVKNVKNLMQDSCLDSALHYILNKDLKRGYSLLRNKELVAHTRIQKKLLVRLLEFLKTQSFDEDDKEFIRRYASRFPDDIMRAHASPEIYCEYWCKMMDGGVFREKFLKKERLSELLYEHFKRTYGSTAKENPSKVQKNFLHYLPKDTVDEVIKKNRETDKDLEWKTIATPTLEAEVKLWPLIKTEKSASERERLYCLMIENSFLFKNIQYAANTLESIGARTQNEESTVNSAIIKEACSIIDFGKGLDSKLWLMTTRFTDINAKRPDARCIPSCFRSAFTKACVNVREDQCDVINSLADLLVDEDYEGLSIITNLREIKNLNMESFIEKLFEKAEAICVKANCTEKTHGLPDLYWAIAKYTKHPNTTIRPLDVLNREKYPKSAETIKAHLLRQNGVFYSFEQEKLRILCDLIKPYITAEEFEANKFSKLYEAEEAERTFRDIKATNALSMEDFDLILEKFLPGSGSAPLAYIVEKSLSGETEMYLNHVLQKLDDHRTSFKIWKYLSLVSTPEQYAKLLSEVPEETGSRNETTEVMLKLQNSSNLSDLRILLNSLEPWLNLKHLRLACGALSSACKRCPREFLSGFLNKETFTSCESVSIRKHILRFKLQIAEPTSADLETFSGTNKHGSLKNEFFRAIYGIIESGGVQHFSLLKEAMNKLQPSDAQCAEFLFGTTTLDHFLPGEQLAELLYKLYEIKFATTTKLESTDYYKRIMNNEAKIPTPSFRKLMEAVDRAESFPPSLIECAALLVVRYEGREFEEFFSYMSKKGDRDDDIGKNLCQYILVNLREDRLQKGTLRPTVYVDLLNHFSKDVAENLDSLMAIRMWQACIGELAMTTESKERRSESAVNFLSKLVKTFDALLAEHGELFMSLQMTIFREIAVLALGADVVPKVIQSVYNEAMTTRQVVILLNLVERGEPEYKCLLEKVTGRDELPVQYVARKKQRLF